MTVLFCDVAGSTQLGERLDPEALRALLVRYFERVRGIVERHGGSVEKFIGDAVMAVFGVPSAHEDDASRAVHAAVEMRSTFPDLGIQGRIGIMTGEVVTGTDERLATGDAINVAARLEQAAQPGEILIGDATYRLVQEIARVDSCPPFELRGKSEPLTAWRLLEVLPEASAFVRSDTPFIGRERELDRLRQVFEATATERRCRLITVVGEPGIGKSRLAHEFVTRLRARAHVFVGRCRAYGERVTYWPLAGIVKQITGHETPAAIAQVLAGEENADLIVELVASALGLSEREATSDETHWAVRELFEALARERPIVVVFEDLHWAEPTFLDLVQYVASFSTQARILLLALARPELLETRPSWGTEGQNAAFLRLKPLSKSEIETLIEQLPTAHEVSEPLRRRILEVAEGNPLFVEQLLAMWAEGKEDELGVPPTLQAVLAARIDGLDAGERSVIECASIEGRGFHAGAVTELLPDAERANGEAGLLALVRKGLIHPDQAELPGDDGFRFVHALIRDAAYGSISKARRADLHERFAVWLERTVKERASEYEEILGYHLEQAHHYRVELGAVDQRGLDIATRAADMLSSGGRRAVRSGDFPAAVNLFDRALVLLHPDAPSRPEILSDLGWTLGWTELARAEAILAEAVGAAAASGNRRVELLASIRRAYVRALMEPEGSHRELLGRAERAIPLLEQLRDEHALVEAWRAIAYSQKGAFRYGPETEALGRALVHARRAGSWRQEKVILAMLVSRLIWGPSLLSEAVRAYEEVLDQVEEDLPLRAEVSIRFAVAQALLGRFPEADALDSGGWTMFKELGLAEVHVSLSHYSGSTYLIAGDAATAERRLRWAHDVLTGSAEKAIRSRVAGLLAGSLYLQGRLEESERFAAIGEDTAASDDVFSQIAWRSARAKVLANRGDTAGAENLAREAIAAAEGTDSPLLRGNTLMDLGEIVGLAGRSDEAARVVEEALQVYELKGNTVLAANARTFLNDLRQRTSAHVRVPQRSQAPHDQSR